MSLPNPLTSYLYRPESNSAHLVLARPPPFGAAGRGYVLKLECRSVRRKALREDCLACQAAGARVLCIEGWRWRVSLCNGWRVEVECRA